MLGYARMNWLSVGIMSIPMSGRLTLSLPLGVPLVCANSCSIVSISEKMRRQLSRNSCPSWVRVTVRVLRWNKRTPSRSSRRATALPMADDERPSWRPASVKLRASAARTKTLRAPRLSKFIRRPCCPTSLEHSSLPWRFNSRRSRSRCSFESRREDQEDRHDLGRSAHPAQVGYRAAGQYCGAQRGAGGESDEHEGGVQRQDDRRNLKPSYCDQPGLLRGEKAPSGEAPDDDRANHRNNCVRLVKEVGARGQRRECQSQKQERWNHHREGAEPVAQVASREHANCCSNSPQENNRADSGGFKTCRCGQIGGDIRQHDVSSHRPDRCDEQCQQHRWTPGNRSAFLQARDRQFVPDVTAETEEQPRRRGK